MPTIEPCWDWSQPNLQVFLSIKILTIRFDLFFFFFLALAEWQEHARPVIFFIMPRKEKHSPPPNPLEPVPSLEAGTEVQPDLRPAGPALSGGCSAASEAAPGIFLGSLRDLKESVC